MDKKSDLTKGKIFEPLVRLALPIAGGQVMHMAYNITDMFWLGRVGSDALAASGIGGLFVWLSVGLMLVGRVGAEIGVAQSRGRGDHEAAFQYSRTALYIAVLLGLAYAGFIFTSRELLVELFGLREAEVAAYTATYMAIIALGMPAMFVTSSIAGTFNASGNSRTPFIIQAFGISLSLAMDPFFIFGMQLGVAGAALTSAIAQNTVMIMMLIALKRSKNRPFENYRLAEAFRLSDIKESIQNGPARQIFKFTAPIFLENTLFPLLTMVTTSFEASFGAFAVAMSRVGSQVESLSWLVGAGFGGALTAFVGQNFGANKPNRIKKGVSYMAICLGLWGIAVTAIMFFGGGIFFAIFLPDFTSDPEMYRIFISYMRILAACQILANLEVVGTFAFRGKGQTIPPSITSITSNIIRVPLALALSRTPLALLGIWTAISLTAALRGLFICLWYIYASRKNQVQGI